MNNTFINVGIIGIGRAGMIHARNYLSCIPNARLLCISDISNEAAKKAASDLGISLWYTDYQDLLNNPDVDAVVVVTPTKFHHDIVIAAANAKKHIFCEKPMAMNAQECLEMEQAAKKNHVKLQIGFMRRFDKNFKEAKSLIEQGFIGDVVSVKSTTHGPSIPKPWMYDISVSNGPLAEVNSHDIDTIRFFTNSDVKSLYAIAGNFRCPEANLNFPDFYDTVLMNLTMNNGCICNIDGAQGVQYGYNAQVTILGTKGYLTIGDMKDKSTVLYTSDKHIHHTAVHSWTDLFKEAYLEEDTSFIHSILYDLEPEVTGYDGRKAVEIVAAGNCSIQTGKIIIL